MKTLHYVGRVKSVRKLCAYSGRIGSATVVLGGETEIDRWLSALKALLVSRDPKCRLLNVHLLVAVATMQLILQEHQQPSRKQIAARVISNGHRCDEKTVYRAHVKLYSRGFLRWDAFYIVGELSGGCSKSGAQPRRAENIYEFLHPPVPLPSPRPSVMARLVRLHSLDRPQKLQVHDGQTGRVSFGGKGTSSNFCGKVPVTIPLEQTEDRKQRNLQLQSEANKKRMRQGFQRSCRTP